MSKPCSDPGRKRDKEIIVPSPQTGFPEPGHDGSQLSILLLRSKTHIKDYKETFTFNFLITLYMRQK